MRFSFKLGNPQPSSVSFPIRRLLLHLPQCESGLNTRKFLFWSRDWEKEIFFLVSKVIIGILSDTVTNLRGRRGVASLSLTASKLTNICWISSALSDKVEIKKSPQVRSNKRKLFRDAIFKKKTGKNMEIFPKRGFTNILMSIYQVFWKVGGDIWSNRINQHQSAWISISQYQSALISTNQHQSASIRINQYQSVSISINQHQTPWNGINRNQSAENDIERHR